MLLTDIATVNPRSELIPPKTFPNKSALKSFLLEIDATNTVTSNNPEKEITLKDYLADPRDSVKNEKKDRNSNQLLSRRDSKINHPHLECLAQSLEIIALTEANLDFQQSNYSRFNNNIYQLTAIVTTDLLIDPIIS